MNKTAFETDSSMRKLLKDGFMTKTVMLRIGVWLVSGSLTLSVQTTRAANIWDGGLGNDGNWNTPANWDNDSVPTFPVALTFAGSIQTANTNNLTGIIVNGFLFDAAAGMFTIDGNAITLGGNIGFTENPSAPITQTINLPMALTGARTLTSEVNGNVLLGGVLSGSGSLLSAGSGTNTLSGNNSFTGGITLNSGTLKATTSANALGAGASTLRLNGGTLHLANDAGLSYNRNTVVSNDVTIVPDRLAAAGTGTTHTLGTLSISNQTLSVAKGPNITGTSVGQVTFGATTLTGDPVFSLAGYSQVQLGNVTESGIPRKLTVKGSGSNPIMILNGTGLWTGGTEMHVGSFLRGNVANSLGASGSMVTVHGGTLDIRANTAGTGRDVQVLSNATVNMRFAVDTTSDFRALSLAADKTLTLSVDRSGTTATSKKLTLNSPFTMLGAGTISVIGGNTFEALLNSGITLGGTLTINPTSAPLTISGVIDDGANTYGIVKTGTGLLTLSGANKYKGGTTVSAGRLLIGSQAAATNAGAVTVNGGIYDLGGLAGVTNGAVTMTSGAISNGTLSATSYSISGGLCYANLAGPGGLA
jgi:autotransporter-associated beta strand protein